MNPFPAYLHEQLEDKLADRRIVVWYDPSREFAPFIEGLAVESEENGLKRVCSGIPSGCWGGWVGLNSGGIVAVLLDPRLLSGKPSACGDHEFMWCRR